MSDTLALNRGIGRPRLHVPAVVRIDESLMEMANVMLDVDKGWLKGCVGGLWKRRFPHFYPALIFFRSAQNV